MWNDAHISISGYKIYNRSYFDIGPWYVYGLRITIIFVFDNGNGLGKDGNQMGKNAFIFGKLEKYAYPYYCRCTFFFLKYKTRRFFRRILRKFKILKPLRAPGVIDIIYCEHVYPYIYIYERERIRVHRHRPGRRFSAITIFFPIIR